MPHYNSSARNALMAAGLGMRVDRAADDVPHTTAEAIFNIVGGRVLMTGILGEVTIQLGAVGNLSLEANPTTGTTAALNVATASAANEVGTLLSISGTIGDNMLIVDAGGTRLGPAPVVLPVGSLDFRASATADGSVKWSIWFLPLDDGAYVTAAAVV
jgi:hypothetical protein